MISICVEIDCTPLVGMSNPNIDLIFDDLNFYNLHLRLQFTMCHKFERLQPLKTCWMSPTFTKPSRLGCTTECATNTYKSTKVSNIIMPKCYRLICALSFAIGGYEPHNIKPTFIV